MPKKPLQIIGTIVLLAAAVGGGWAATNLFQRTVPIVPGIQGCWRLEGTARQVSCLSDEFANGADEAASDTGGARRDAKVIEYVRRAERLAAQDSRLASTCHPAMHDLGRREGRRAAREKRVPTFPGGASQLCTAGYVHGLAEGYLAHDPSADVAAVFPTLCHDARAREGCAHGVGHALLRARIDDGPREASADALEACIDLPEAVRVECTNGVYMEVAMRTKPETVPVEEFVEVCRAADDVDRRLSCWAYLPLNLTANDVETDAVPRWCGTAPLPSQFTCIEAYGRQLGVDGVKSCADAAKRVTLQERCIEGAIGLQVGSGHVTAAEARRSCRSISSSSLEAHCLGAVKRYLRGRAEVEGTRA